MQSNYNTTVIAEVEELPYETNQSDHRSKTINNEPKPDSGFVFNELRENATTIYVKFAFFFIFTQNRCTHLQVEHIIINGFNV